MISIRPFIVVYSAVRRHQASIFQYQVVTRLYYRPRFIQSMVLIGFYLEWVAVVGGRGVRAPIYCLPYFSESFRQDISGHTREQCWRKLTNFLRRNIIYFRTKGFYSTEFPILRLIERKTLLGKSPEENNAKREIPGRLSHVSYFTT